MLNISEILLDAHSPEIQKRKPSLELLNQLTESNPGSLFTSISILLNSSEPFYLRKCSGTFIKSSITQKWLQIPESQKQQIKINCLSSLASPDNITSACLAISTLASLELPGNNWPELFQILLQNCHNSNHHYKLASLMALNYICQDIKPEYFPSSLKNEILTAIVANLNSKEHELVSHCFDIFVYALQFFEENFQVKQERKVIFQALFECFPINPYKCTQAFCEIMNLFPENIQDEVEKFALITFAGIQNGDESTKILAVEIWNTSADVDENRMSSGQEPLGYIRRVCLELTDPLLQVFFAEDIQEDSWNLGKCVFNFFTACSRLCPEENCFKVNDFLEKNLNLLASEAQIRAGLTVLSAITECPRSDNCCFFDKCFKICLDLVEKFSGKTQKLALLSFSNLLKNSILQLSSNDLNRALTLLKSLIFRNTCDLKSPFTALQSLLKSYGYRFSMNDFQVLLDNLLSLIPQKPCKYEKKEQEILQSLINFLGELPDSYNSICSRIFPEITKILKLSISSKDTFSISKFSELMNLTICRLKPGGLSLNEIEMLFKLALSVINQFSIIEDSFGMIGAIALNSGRNFENHYKHISPIVLHHLSLVDFHDTLSAALLLTSDLARALRIRIVDSFHLYLPALYNILENNTLKLSHKVQAINCLGDFAESAQAAIVVHLDKIFKYVDAAAGISLDLEVERETGESLGSLREVILQFYLSLFIGLSESKQQGVINDRIPKLSMFVLMVVDQKFKPNIEIHRNSVWIISDIVKIWGKNLAFLDRFVEYLKSVVLGFNEIADDARVVIGNINLSS